MKITKLKKINFFLTIRYLYPITIVLIVIVLIFLMKFLYNNVYQTIIQAKLITDLRKEISDQNLEKAKFEQIIENLKLKTEAEKIDISQIKDPFRNLSAPVPETP